MRRTSYQHRGAIESPGFTRADCGHKGGRFQDRRGSWRQRHNLAVLFLQLSDVIRERGLEGLRHTEEGSGFIHSFLRSAAIQWIAAQPNMAALRGEGQSQ